MNKFILSTFAILYLSLGLQAQQPEQDCINALPVCQNVYTQSNSYSGIGLGNDEINSANSCLGAGELNDVWYIFTVQSPGNVCFTITPNSGSDDYDWAVYNLTSANCSDIFNNASLEVSCNFSGNIGCGGTTGPNNNTSGACGGQNESCIPVLAGQTYVVNVSNFSSTQSGYTLDFSQSSAVIFDNIPPEMQTVNVPCGGASATFTVTFSENILCSTVAASDFTFSGPGGPYTVTSVSGNACTAGGTFENTFTVTVSPMPTTGIYSLDLVGSVTDNCGNVAPPASQVVPMSSTILTMIPSDTLICEGSPATLGTGLGNPGAGYNFTWQPGGMTTPQITVTPTATTTYTVTVTDPGGCNYNGTVTVDFIPKPTFDLALTPTSICGFGPISTGLLNNNVPPDWVPTWNFGGATVLSGSGNGPYDLEWTTSGVQNVEVYFTSVDGCVTNTMSASVDLNEIPSANFSPSPTAVCRYSDITFNYTGTPVTGQTYQWTFDGGAVPASSTLQTPTVNYPIDGTHNVTLLVTTPDGCTQQLQQTVTIYPEVTASSGPSPIFFCVGGDTLRPIVNTGTAPFSYNWSCNQANCNLSDATVLNPLAIPTVSTDYSLVVTDTYGCVSQPVTVTVTPYPLPNSDFSYAMPCENTPTQFTSLASVTGSNIAYWAWNFGDDSLLIDNATNPVHSYEVPGPGIYPVTLAVRTSDGCVDTTIKDIEIFEAPFPGFTATRECLGTPTMFLDTTILQDTLVNWIWNFGDGTTESGISNPSHVYATNGNFPTSLQVITDEGCTRTTTQNVFVKHIPLPITPTEDTVCLGERATLFASISQQYHRAAWYEEPVATLQPFFTGNMYLTPPLIYDVTYYVASISSENCISPLTAITAHVFNESDIEIIAPEVVYMPAEPVNFSINPSTNIATYSWTLGENAISSLPQPVHEYQYPGRYEITVSVIDNNGCPAEAKKPLEVKANVNIDIPSAFTPNGDGYNDVFFIGHYNISQFAINIFDRWGERVYTSNDPNFRWNGTSNNKDVQEGVYMYEIVAKDFLAREIRQNGTITIIR